MMEVIIVDDEPAGRRALREMCLTELDLTGSEGFRAKVKEYLGTLRISST